MSQTVGASSSIVLRPFEVAAERKIFATTRFAAVGPDPSSDLSFCLAAAKRNLEEFQRESLNLKLPQFILSALLIALSCEKSIIVTRLCVV